MSPVNQLDSNEKQDIFEAITVIAKRARQINQERSEKFKIKSYLSEEELEDSLEYDEIDFSSLEKPSTIAMEEFKNGKIDFGYKDEEKEEKEEEKEKL
jgi:DNA-directed RNA polymerase subunit K/omega